MKNKINIDEHNKIINMYNSGMSIQKIADKYLVSSSVIRNILIKYNVETRDNSHKGRKYTLDENYFDRVDSYNKAYILGLLYADGCNYTKSNHVFIELQERDKKILEDINKELGSDRPLLYNDLHSKNENWQSTYRLSFVNKHMSSVLSELGLVANKSLILEFPQWLDESLYPHFLRGYMDGDGHLEIESKNKFLTCVGTKMFCESIKDICKKILDIDVSIHNISSKKDSVTKIIYICGKTKIKMFLDYIYNDAELYIERKYKSYKSFCEFYNTNNSLSA